MIRRAIVVTGVMVAATAVAAMAFVPDVSRIGREWGSRMHARLQGFTPDPQRAGTVFHDAKLPVQDPDTAAGTYCPIPPKPGSLTAASGQQAPDSSATLILEGKTEVPAPTGSAICVGVPANGQRPPRLINP